MNTGIAFDSFRAITTIHRPFKSSRYLCKDLAPSTYNTLSINKKFLETDYPRDRAIGVFPASPAGRRRFHFGLRAKNRNFVFYLTRNCEKRFRPLPRRGEQETPRQSLEEFFSIKKGCIISLYFYNITATDLPSLGKFSFVLNFPGWDSRPYLGNKK